MKTITIIAYSNSLNSMYQTEVQIQESDMWCDAKSIDLILDKLSELGFKGLRRWDIMVRYSLDKVPKKHKKKALYNI